MSLTPLILNPAAGGGRCGRREAQAVDALGVRGVEVQVWRTDGPGHATALAAQAAAAGHERVLCAGGDGTVYEVINGLLPAAAPPAVGCLPLGTGNSFLADFGPVSLDRQLDAVAADRRHPVDVVRVEHTQGTVYSLNLVAVGFVSDVGATTNRWFKPLGALGYVAAVVLETARLAAQPFPHRLDGGRLDTTRYDFLTFSNSRCTGGAMIMAPQADVADGRLDVVHVGDLGRLGLLRQFPKIFRGAHLTHPLNGSTTAARVDFELDRPLPIMLDGEVRHLHLEALVVEPGALEVIA